MNRSDVELLAPAGDPECLQAALAFGADAVYLGGDVFTMRCGHGFSAAELADAAKSCHALGKKLYLTCNTLPREGELAQLPAFLEQAQAIKADALIAGDLGVMALAKKYAPDVPLHVSTQAGVVNSATANALHDLSATRVVLARECALEEIGEIRTHIPDELELEAFCHGAMCMSVSGRCLLSTYLTGRDANRGACAQPCRWRYALTEEKRPGQFFAVEEDDKGSYLLNANDLCMIAHLKQMLDAGITSLKVEGRGKSAFYVAAVVHAYRAALDAVFAGEACPDFAQKEVELVSHRPYSTGFYLGNIPGQRTESGGYLRSATPVAVQVGWADGTAHISLRNRFVADETLLAIAPGQPPFWVSLKQLTAQAKEGCERVQVADRVQAVYSFACQTPLPAHTWLVRTDGGN